MKRKIKTGNKAFMNPRINEKGNLAIAHNMAMPISINNATGMDSIINMDVLTTIMKMIFARGSSLWIRDFPG